MKPDIIGYIFIKDFAIFSAAAVHYMLKRDVVGDYAMNVNSWQILSHIDGREELYAEWTKDAVKP